MFAQVIELKKLHCDFENDIEELIEYFICSLINNGQILSEYTTVKNENSYDLFVTTPKCDSLETCYDSIYVKRDRNLLGKHFKISIRQLGINIKSREYCMCKKRTSIEMRTFVNDIDSVFTCCNCGKLIALYELPYLNGQDDHWSIVNWQKTYCAMHTLWLDSLSDRFTGNQLVKVNSALNKRGCEIAQEIGRKTGTKVYYNVFDDLTKKVQFTKINDKVLRICPSCKNAMKYIKLCDNYERYICEDCNLSSDLPTCDPL